MKLFSRHFEGKGKDMIVLHGLFGSSKNWLSAGKRLSEKWNVHLLDLRNHGDSPHYATHSLLLMAEDIAEYIRTEKLHNPVILGHSMGGLAAMKTALLFPELIDSLIIIDIAPKNYSFEHKKEFEALHLNVENKKSRQEIDEEMKKIIPDEFKRQFLQMNLERTDTGFRWKLGIHALETSTHSMELDFPEHFRFTRKTMFIFGENSEYNTPDAPELVSRYFPNSEIRVIKGAGHYLHYLNAEEFLSAVMDFQIE
ncbi:MAG TPA: alpha/beta fold hydrolase [Leptospiraceae bacterium]|nr:alpha/beta fold hydrolase [Leptospiraceae bacterium]